MLTTGLCIESFLLEPQSTTVPVGSSLTLHCSIQDKQPTSNVEWLKDFQSISLDRSTTNPHYSISAESDGTESYHLIIDSVTLSDEGAYVCFVKGGAPMMSDTATVDVVEVQAFIREPTSKTVTVDSTVDLNCEVYFKEGDVVWRKDGTALSNDTQIEAAISGRLSVVGSHPAGEYNLRITSAQLDDSGCYWCEVTAVGYSLKIVSHNATLNVKRKQALVTLPVSVTIDVGMTAFMNCSIRDKYGVQNWTRSDDTVSTEQDLLGADPRFSVVVHEGRDYHLVIVNAQITDSGSYVCSVSGGEYEPSLSQTSELLVIDVNYCDSDPCDDILACKDQPGSYDCVCTRPEGCTTGDACLRYIGLYVCRCERNLTNDDLANPEKCHFSCLYLLD
ncbi:peroxidasin-like [Ptychodera flava]|uniref:peroxidasin-like n=1 Tax=Ptychodera flava TaxID=63121 RepID=UPI00396A64D4